MSRGVLPQELQPLYDSLNHELIWVHAKWQVYRQIFAGSQEDFDLLNRTAPFFFRVLQQTLFEDVLVSICRLTDPAHTGEKQNRSLGQLLERLEAAAPAPLFAELTTRLVGIGEGSAAFREWRNRRIAHSDLSTALRVTEDILPGISRADIETVLLWMRDFMNIVSAFDFNSETAYDHFIAVSGGDALLRMLHKADESAREERERQELELQKLMKGKSA